MISRINKVYFKVFVMEAIPLTFGCEPRFFFSKIASVKNPIHFARYSTTRGRLDYFSSLGSCILFGGTMPSMSSLIGYGGSQSCRHLPYKTRCSTVKMRGS